MDEVPTARQSVKAASQKEAASATRGTNAATVARKRSRKAAATTQMDEAPQSQAGRWWLRPQVGRGSCCHETDGRSLQPIGKQETCETQQVVLLSITTEDFVISLE